VLTLPNADGSTSQRRIPGAQTDYRDFYANLRDAILGKAAPVVTHQQALDVMQALELARDSSLQRRTLSWPVSNSLPV